MKSYGVTIQMKATEQYFSVVLFIVLYKMVLKTNFQVFWSLWYCIRKAKRMEDISMAQQQPNPRKK